MSSLKPVEKAYFERLLEMGDGNILDFSLPKFASFFRDTVGIDIEADIYRFIGDSKAKRLRAFWEKESDQVVGESLKELLHYWEFKYPVPDNEQLADFEKCEAIVARLIGEDDFENTEPDKFLQKDLTGVSLQKIPLSKPLLTVLETRYTEASGCLRNGHSLATIFWQGVFSKAYF